MVRFQTNFIFKIYKGVIQKKNMNMNKKGIDEPLAKKVLISL